VAVAVVARGRALCGCETLGEASSVDVFWVRERSQRGLWVRQRVDRAIVGDHQEAIEPSQ
jgi:hypothetical protein